MKRGTLSLLAPVLLAPALVTLGALASGCDGGCPEGSVTLTLTGEPYCGQECERCADCPDGFSCQRRDGRSACVDEAFLTDRGLSTACEDPCPSGEYRYDDMGTETCVAICTVDGECPHCCVEPPEIEFRICLPRAELCP